MGTPAYHLRTNKAIDRFLFLEVIRNLVSLKDSGEYSYCSFGGPYLDDFRLVHESFPKMELVSIEQSQDVYKRQKFNLPSGNIQLLNTELNSFLSTFTPTDKKYIFWLDYTSLRYSQFEEFKRLITQLPEGSIVKVTFQCEPQLYLNKRSDQKDKDGNYVKDKEANFRSWFQNIMPPEIQRLPRSRIDFAKLLTSMIRIAAQQALPNTGVGNILIPATNMYYKDVGGIFTFTGIVTNAANAKAVKSALKHLDYTNTSWRKKPLEIDIPVLSTKERLHLQSDLPCAGGKLQKKLGYKIGENSLDQLKQYSKFYREYPYFIRAVI